MSLTYFKRLLKKKLFYVDRQSINTAWVLPFEMNCCLHISVMSREHPGVDHYILIVWAHFSEKGTEP